MEIELFGDPQLRSDQQLEAYEHQGGWVNRMILGDSLVVMNSLLEYEGLGGQVQMIYIDPPYGVKFGSNFQPFVRKRDVKHNDDEDMTREPEMVKAYRDTWELGLHSYLTYLRDRLLVARELLTPSGSVFVQISDENVHHVRELLDEVFGDENFCRRDHVREDDGRQPSRTLLCRSRRLPCSGTREIASGSSSGSSISTRQLAERVRASTHASSIGGRARPMTPEERRESSLLPEGARSSRSTT